jgi:2-oxoisovalerate dehydrogenase E1 component alpha subunit
VDATEGAETVGVREAPSPADLGLGDDDLRGMYRTMLLARAVDERMWLLQRQGKIAFAVSCQGHEAAQVGAAWALDRRRDWFFAYYRDLAAALVLGFTPRDLLLAAFGRAADPSSGGRQMPNHFSSRSLRVVSQSSVVATQLPQAAGVALALRLQGRPGVVYVSFGEGSTSEGDFHEGLNFASVHRLPVIFFCQNNRYAISVPAARQMAVPSVADRASAYGVPGVSVDGGDPLAVYGAMRRAVDRARAGEGPTLLEARVDRHLPHSSGDDDRRYRSRQEVEEGLRRDPIERFRAVLMAAGVLDDALDGCLREEVRAEVDEATDSAERSPLPDPETGLRHVYWEGA